MEEKEIRNGIYEIGYLMVPTIAEENVGGEVTAFKDMLTGYGVAFVSDEYPKMMELAYEMTTMIANKKVKFNHGYFGWVKFECTRSAIGEIKIALDKSEKFVRYLIVKTVRESTLAPKRAYGKEGGVKRHTKKVSEEAPQAINEETIDKDIDALVVE